MVCAQVYMAERLESWPYAAHVIVSYARNLIESDDIHFHAQTRGPVGSGRQQGVVMYVVSTALFLSCTLNSNYIHRRCIVDPRNE